MTDLPANLRTVFEAIQKHPDGGISVSDICKNQEVAKLSDKPDTLRSYVNYAVEKLISLGYVRTHKSARPRTYVVDETTFEKIVVSKIQDIANTFFRGDVSALIQFAHATVKKGSLR